MALGKDYFKYFFPELVFAEGLEYEPSAKILSGATWPLFAEGLSVALGKQFNI